MLGLPFADGSPDVVPTLEQKLPERPATPAERSLQIGRFPNAGRIVPELEHPEIREVIEPPYRIVYRAGARGCVDSLSLVTASAI